MNEIKRLYDIHKQVKHPGWGARYVLDTVPHHEENTTGLFRYENMVRDARGFVIDIGTNAGGTAFAVAQNPNVTDVIGVDFHIDMLRIAHEPVDRKEFCHPPTWELPDTWVLAEACHLPFRDEVFDTVIMGEILEHLPYPELAVKEAKRVVKRGGNILVTTPLTELNPRGHVRVFTVEEVQHLFRRFRMKIVDVKTTTRDEIGMMYMVAHRSRRGRRK
jgi:ubiquinone/menaquinone biosynthesis C-methylase UbiE